MPILLIVLFILVPIAELYVIIQVGQEIGVVPTLLILIADSVLGSILLRSQGRTVWRRFREANQAGRIPHREVLDGVLVIFGGAFLLTPGFLTDVLGLLLLIPPTRAFFRRAIVRTLTGGLAMGGPAGFALRRVARRRARPYDVEGTATEGDGPPDGPRPRLEG